MRQLLGFIALSLPLVIWLLGAFTGITPRWHFSEHFRLYDLCADALALLLCCAGLAALLRRADLPKALVGVAVVFGLLQFWTWQAAPARALATVAIADGVVVALAVDRAELTVDGAVDLVQYRTRYGLFIEPVATLAQWNQVYRIGLSPAGAAQVQVTLEMYDHQVRQQAIAISP